MCGIVGMCPLKKGWNEELNDMRDTMINRGPDGYGTWSDLNDSIALGHRRLSILDLSDMGAQPMQSHNKRLIITYNGEIYNFNSIKNELPCNFRGNSDTEVLLEAFSNWGIDQTLKKIVGMYAIALYDREKKELVLIRDCMGEKPLYYGFVKGQFVFCSDINAFKKKKDFERKINLCAIADYVNKAYIPGPDTIFEGVYKLQPGEILRISAPFRNYQIEKYYSLEEVAEKGQKKMFLGNFEDASLELERILNNTVEKQLIADVPVGTFLSGGIDSTLITSIASKKKNNLKTFSIGYKNSNNDEAIYAKKISEYLGTSHTELYIDDGDIVNAVTKMPNVFGQPFACYSAIPLFLISQLASKSVKVTLGGDGGDEFYCGYDKYWLALQKWNMIRFIPNRVKEEIYSTYRKSNLLQKSALLRRNAKYLQYSSEMEIYCSINDDVNKENLYLIDGINIKRENKALNAEEIKGILNKAMLYDEKDCLVDNGCMKVDCTGMASSMEIRTPFLDKELVDFCWTLPADYKYKRGQSKRILREVLYKYVPKELIERPKQPFYFPAEEWLKSKKMKELAMDMLSYEKISSNGIFSPQMVENMWKEYVLDQKYDSKIWFILMYQIWEEGQKASI